MIRSNNSRLGGTLPELQLHTVFELPSGRHAELVDFIAGRCLLQYMDDQTEVVLQSKLLKVALESPLLTGRPTPP